ncbi:dihydroneopterin aldolase [Campylobacter geochelonis]|uniref:Uncharacterized protein n=1 Tax=Campylobacter geochelonis TaxID=1780362 RepID=A0A128EGN5_9BACT|nr:dihydroneopterin aldolase [Campylobacter geochelonis]QKF71400.1 DsbI-accessory protein Dba [Campylobacter geochelonis]CZE47737.1 Uncharacterised protein [Campylobacter geochelonis]CZE48419.1 Uncharacterised protein [Campylobacter geochelonis]CZE50899.1 Uncharacterised protein [Campylobacter geochelonis]
MEFLELIVMLFVAFLIYKKPKKESLAFNLLAAVFVVIAFIFFAIDIQFFLLPPMNL